MNPRPPTPGFVAYKHPIYNQSTNQSTQSTQSGLLDSKSVNAPVGIIIVMKTLEAK